MGTRQSCARLLPLAASAALILAACGSDGAAQVVAGPQAPVPDAAANRAGPGSAAGAAAVTRGPESAATVGRSRAVTAEKRADASPAASAPGARQAPERPSAGKAVQAPKMAPAERAVKSKAAAAAPKKGTSPSARTLADQAAYDRTGGATDVGITKTEIKLGSVNMHGMPAGNMITKPLVRAIQGSITAVNDRGGVLGRRLSLADCDDGNGDTARGKACIKKLVGSDKIFSLITGIDWATASIHEDLKQDRLPYVGAWAYSQTEWQDPYMFPTHMSMIHEAMAGANWVRDVIKPKTYGLLCLTSPEMQLACDQVQKVLDPTGAKLVKRVEVGITETTMSSAILAMRGAAPEHIIHYVINPVTVAKFILEATQQDYYPPKGISGNHLAAEVLGSVFGKFPVNRYWTNTTYKLWGTEFMATMNRYARGNKGAGHHIAQAGYVGVNFFAQAAKNVGPNLTRERLMAELGNGTVWRSDASLDQKFAYIPSERLGENWSMEYGQGREFMYKYTDMNTVSRPDGSPSGWSPDPDQFVIHTN